MDMINLPKRARDHIAHLSDKAHKSITSLQLSRVYLVYKDLSNVLHIFFNMLNIKPFLLFHFLRKKNFQRLFLYSYVKI